MALWNIGILSPLLIDGNDMHSTSEKNHNSFVINSILICQNLVDRYTDRQKHTQARVFIELLRN